MALVVVLCVVAIGAIWWTQRGKDVIKDEAMKLAPKVEMMSLSITGIDENELKLTVHATIKNTLRADIVIDSLRYQLYIDSSKVVESIHPQKITIKQAASGNVELPMELNMDKLGALIRKMERQDRDSAIYTLKANFKMKIPIAGVREFNLDESKKLPALKAIHVTPGKIDIHKMGLKKTDATVNMKIENDNVFPIRIKDGKFTMEVEHGITVTGNYQKVVNIPAKGSGIIEMHVNSQTGDLAKLGWKWLFKEHRTHYKMNFTSTIESDSEIMHTSKMTTNMAGTLDELKQLTKKLKK
jgi:LEA14-like dessication related protein